MATTPASARPIPIQADDSPAPREPDTRRAICEEELPQPDFWGSAQALV